MKSDVKIGSLHNILVIKLDHLGDMLWATPTFAALRYKYPEAKIQAICLGAVEPVLRQNPAVDQILVYDRAKFSSSQQKSEWLRQKIGRPDVAICLDTRDEAILLAYLSEAPIRAGYFYKDRPFSMIKTWRRMTHKFAHPTMGSTLEHEVVNNIRLLERINLLSLPELPADLLNTRIFLSPEEKLQSEKILSSLGLMDKPLIMYNIPNKTINRGWPKEHIAKIANQLGRTVSNCRILVVAGPGEEALLDAVSPLLPACCHTLSRLPLRIWAGLFSHCLFSLSRDAGAVHVSAAMGIPVISIFEESLMHMQPCWESWNILHCNVVRPDSPTQGNVEKHVTDVSTAAMYLWKKVSNAH